MAFAVESRSRAVFATFKASFAPVELATAPALQPLPNLLLFNLSRLELVGRPPDIASNPARSFRSPKAFMERSVAFNALSIGSPTRTPVASIHMDAAEKVEAGGFGQRGGQASSECSSRA